MVHHLSKKQLHVVKQNPKKKLIGLEEVKSFEESNKMLVKHIHV